MDPDLSTLTLYLSDSSDAESSAQCTQTQTRALRRQKLHQTEASFKLQKAAWTPKDDILLAASTLALPAADLASAAKISASALKAKAEREYYLRRYPSAIASAKEALRRIAVSQEGSSSVKASEEDKRDLTALLEKCAARLQNENRDTSGEEALEA